MQNVRKVNSKSPARTACQRFKTAVTALCASLPLFLSAAAPGGNQPTPPRVPHLVFAHYMVCFATYGESIEAYQREIREAQAAGIDGFALNVGAWSAEPVYKARTRLIYDAAERLGTGFRLFFSMDMSGTNDIQDAIRTFKDRPSTFRCGDKIVVSTFGRNQLDWKGGVFEPLKAEGVDVFFVPFFWPNPVTELPGYQDAVGILNTYSNLLDGLFLFGAAGLPAQLAAANAAYARALRETGKLFMAGYTPHYWGSKQSSDGRRYYETSGGEGTELQWSSIITNRPDWVQIVTWNDFNESTYLCPVADPGKYFDELLSPVRNSHAAYLELSRYFIQWFKTDHQPAIEQDALFYFYRVHPKDLVAAGHDLPVSALIGDVQDAIYFTSMLAAPAELKVSTGGLESTLPLLPGIHHVRVPFRSGPQTFRVLRNGREVVVIRPLPIGSSVAKYNFFPASGFAYLPGTR